VRRLVPTAPGRGRAAGAGGGPGAPLARAAGRTCHNKRVLFAADAAVPGSLAALRAGPPGAPVELRAGDYAAVRVTSAGVQSLHAAPLARTTAAEFVARYGSTLPGGAEGACDRGALRAAA